LSEERFMFWLVILLTNIAWGLSEERFMFWLVILLTNIAWGLSECFSLPQINCNKNRFSKLFIFWMLINMQSIKKRNYK
jgi:hypothetical protein